ncbi:uncharacterized protein LOC128552298 isoform X1 [Mercenaria mercenaria]|uniref:uncharacterized protein LOC128552298 isoform X1 n=1 Tax=Mercenaria mercenaria TaxID=6596 RepID=UPI00234F9907|nr:uncharacterized protein LOC128552298 isoform X1 [Mercenaria mercenaria]
MTPLKFVLILYLLTFCFSEGQNIDDPCTSATILYSLKQRVIGYTLSANETFLCDYYMKEGWYSMGSYAIASSEKPCGTVFNMYMPGALPKDDIISEMSVCLKGVNGTICSKTIKVKRCEEKRYVFDLFAPDGCPEAYCIEAVEMSGTTNTEGMTETAGVSNKTNITEGTTRPVGLSNTTDITDRTTEAVGMSNKTDIIEGTTKGMSNITGTTEMATRSEKDHLVSTPPPEDWIIANVSAVALLFVIVGFFLYYRRNKNQCYTVLKRQSTVTPDDDTIYEIVTY